MLSRLQHSMRASSASMIRSSVRSVVTIPRTTVAQVRVVLQTPIMRALHLSAFRTSGLSVEAAASKAEKANNEVARVNSIVVTAAGPDRAGIVHDVSALLIRSGANIEESRMTILGNEFAILLRVTVPESLDASKLKQLLEGEFTEFAVSARATTSQPPIFSSPVRIFSVAVEGPDQPGIVQTLTKTFLEHKGSIRDLDTDTSTAPFAGYKIFSLKCVIALPITADFESFEAAMHKFEDEYGFDVDISEGMNEQMEEDGENEEGEGEGEGEEEEAQYEEPPRRRLAPGQSPQSPAMQMQRRSMPTPPPQQQQQQQASRGPSPGLRTPNPAPARGPVAPPRAAPQPAPRGPAPNALPKGPSRR